MLKNEKTFNSFIRDAIFWDDYRCLGIDNRKSKKGLIYTSIITFKFLLRRSGRFSLLLRLSQLTRLNFLESFFLGLLNWIYSCDISKGSKFMPEVFFPHPIGIVIGSRSIILSKCVIFNDITIGKKYPGLPGKLPTIGAGTYIFPGARVLGDIKIGTNCVIATNSIISISCDNNSTISKVNSIKKGTYLIKYNHHKLKDS